MNWITFLSYLGICYALYYLVVFALDSRASPGGGGKPETTVLTFSEDYPTEKVLLEDVHPGPQTGQTDSAPASVGLGGVTMQNFFALAQTEALQYTRSVSF